MFLKRIEMQGFKSFADKVVIHFEHDVTGIVGPNGCGKSNITDAIRWVLGEQSVKSLRGSAMTDVIFAGSADRRMVNMAEVTLVFDNSRHDLNSDLEEIEITRRLYRNSGEAQYLINRNPVRLKDVVDLILDSGLGKDSLSMISQGNISAFAEAKPIERRAIFEEAAGVSKYKKRKIESLSKLERTKENLERTEDILSELERQVSPLKRQARKAEIYREKKERLQQIEIAVLVEDITLLNQQIDEAVKTLFDIETASAMHQTTIQVHETANLQAKRESSQLENDINRLQDELIRVVNEIQTLETRKIELDEKRKYAIEVGTREEKARELQSLLEEARFEYEDRQQRLNQLLQQIELLSQQLSQIAMELAENSQKNDEAAGILRRLQNRREVLENLARQPFQSQAGVKAVMDSQAFLPGVLGVVAKVLQPHKGYEEAISVALGGAMYNIVTTDEASARGAIRFLKNNQSGRATFLPLRVLKPRWIASEHRVLAENTEGYLGNARQFVDCDAQFDLVAQSLLQNVLVCDTLEHGNALADLLKFSYKIVTLDGDVIHRGGSMTGGRSRNASSVMTVSRQLEELEKTIQSQQAKCQLAQKAWEQSSRRRSECERTLTEKRIASAQLEPVVDAKRAKYERLKNDYERLAPQQEEAPQQSFADTLIQSLNQSYSRRDEISGSLSVKRQQKMKLNADIERREQQIRQIRKELETATASAHAIQLDKAKLETRLESNLARLTSEYQLTFEYARSQVEHNPVDNAKEEVLQLRAQIEALGNINMNAPEEYDEVNSRYEFMRKHRQRTAGTGGGRQASQIRTAEK